MRISLSYDSETIKKLIQEDIIQKIGVSVPSTDIKVLVRSKQNYRENQFERGELKCDLDANI